jgi:hypothetical protein
MPHLFYFSMVRGPSTNPSGFSPEEKAVEQEPRSLARLGGNVRSLTNRIVSSQSRSQRLRSHFKAECCRYRALPLAAVSVLYNSPAKDKIWSTGQLSIKAVLGQQPAERYLRTGAYDTVVARSSL